ncbi:MAG: hypothetical protein ABFS35_23165 [Bacteroidota bacterium]
MECADSNLLGYPGGDYFREISCDGCLIIKKLFVPLHREVSFNHRTYSPFSVHLMDASQPDWGFLIIDINMALRNQPYLPLYVQDYLTDEKLNMCSLATQGVYIKIMCIMHKSEEYGVILLKQKDKQTGKQIKNFALKLAKLLPIMVDDILSAITELIEEQVLFIDGEKLCQKRMIKDNDISEKRSEAGSKGGKRTQFAKAKSEANTEIEDEIEDEIEIKKIPTLKDVEKYFIEKGYKLSHAKKAFNHYDSLDWHNAHGKPVKNWKNTMANNWFSKEFECEYHPGTRVEKTKLIF